MNCPKCQKENPYKLGTRAYTDGIFQMRKCSGCAHVFKAEFLEPTELMKNYVPPIDEELFDHKTINRIKSKIKEEHGLDNIDDETIENVKKEIECQYKLLMVNPDFRISHGDVMSRHEKCKNFAIVIWEAKLMQNLA